MPICSLGEHTPHLPAEGSYWIAPTAYVIGKVRLGNNCGVWFGAVLRGDNDPIDVGDDTNIQEHAMFHTDIGVPLKVGRGCTIGHRALLHGCAVGDNALIGIGATVLNNAVIGENCLIGAHALVPEGKVIPPGTLAIGAPAKVVRDLTPDEITRLRWSSQHYVENWRRFAAQFRERA
jgi:carbonic anhydrase/acetyltransferase-like protein (isoleucine patch superfamily)